MNHSSNRSNEITRGEYRTPDEEQLRRLKRCESF